MEGAVSLLVLCTKASVSSGEKLWLMEENATLPLNYQSAVAKSAALLKEREQGDLTGYV